LLYARAGDDGVSPPDGASLGKAAALRQKVGRFDDRNAVQIGAVSVVWPGRIRTCGP
jgi:hypothetical protein